jgi:pectate lyase
MKKIAATLMTLATLGINAQTPSFPGAEGAGKFVTGGRGGRVIYVTSLEDTNTEGTLRWAINQSGARTVLFKVSGIIDLTGALNIKNGNVTIAGQTAPGDGICLRNYPVQNSADNVIIRYMRFRMGDAKQAEGDAIWGRERQNIIIDHCSMSWCTDECASFYDNTNFTLQWCIMSESLRNSVHGKGKHGYGGIWGGKTASFHHNLLAHHDSRNPRMCGSRYSNKPELELVDFRNNVIYNWGANSGYAGEGGRYNFINNYYKPGPASTDRARIFQPNADGGDNAQPAGIWGVFHVNGNYVGGSPAATNDNWNGIHPSPSSKNRDELKSIEPFAVPSVITHSARTAYEKVLAYAGASLHRDAVDERIVREVRDSVFTCTGSNGSTNGLIDSQTDAGGWPDCHSVSAPEDANNDGIPDHFPLPPGKTANDLNEEGYTYLEVYINSLVDEITKQQYENALSNEKIPVDRMIKNIEYYSMTGQRIYHVESVRGVVIIKKTTFTDGTFASEKFIRK